MMPIILFIILVPAHYTFPLPSSPLTLSLTSGSQTQQIPPKNQCSCQLPVFGVYGDAYTLEVKASEGEHSWVKVKIRSSSQCWVEPLDDSRATSLNINSTIYNGYEVTESFYIQIFTPNSRPSQQTCEGIEDTGEQRLVYLVNRTKSQADGQYQYIINLPTNSIALTQAVSFIILCLLSHNIKYRRFTPIQFNFVFVLIYTIFLFATIYVDTFVEQAFQVAFWLTMAVALGCNMVYFVDISSVCLNKTTAIVGTSLFMTILVGALDLMILPDAWPVNNLIGILVAGALIKFVVVKKLKTAVFPLLFLWVFFLFRQFIVVFHLQNFEQALHIKIVPLFLQVPAIFDDDATGFICSAFGTSKIITMGLVLNYCVRVDLFLSTRFYTMLCSIIAFLCLALECIIMVFADELPVLQFTSVIVFLPVSFTLILLLSSKRGEWAELWHGSFHDIAVDRKSIKRESESILDEQELERNLDRLKMNPSLLTSTS